MKRKVLAIMMCGTMIASMIAGCGNTADDNTTGGTETADAQTTGSTEDTYNVIMQWPTLAEAPAGLADVENAINAISEPEIGVTVTLQPVNPFNIGTETSLAVSSGEKLDLCLSLFSGIGDYVNTGCVIAIDDLLDTYGQDIEAICGDQLAGGAYNGTQYAVPVAYVNGQDAAFVCRQDILDKYNISIDTDKVYSYEELTEIFATVKSGEGDSFYMVAGAQTAGDTPLDSFYMYDYLGALPASGVLMFSDDTENTTVVDLYETEDYAEYAQHMYDWAQAGYFPADAALSTETDMAQVMSGNFFGSFQMDCGAAASGYSNQAGMEMTAIRTRLGMKRTSEYQSILWGVATTSENPEKAMQFLNLIYANPDVANLLQFGIEGQSYEVVEQDENGTVITFPEGLNTDTVPYWQAFGVYGDRLSWHVMTPSTTNTNDILRAFSDNLTSASPALGYTFCIDNVASEYSAVSSVISQYRALINTGAIAPEKELPEFISALKDAGIDKVIEENQKQLDAWLAEQK